MSFKDKKIHFVGIKGVGMTALAQILKAQGAVVSGSDGDEVFFTDEVLKKIGITPKKYNAENITSDLDFVISSTAYYFNGESQGSNPEITAAEEQQRTILTYPEALGMLAKDYRVIAVAGSNGKSTTTAMLGWILEKADSDPTVIVGTKVKQWETNARAGKSDYLIIEADEYREAFLRYTPHGAVITNISYDHPDYFKTEADYNKSFEAFADSIERDGFLVTNSDQPELRAIEEKSRAKNIKVIRGVEYDTQSIIIQFPGALYRENAAAALLVARELGVTESDARAALQTFPGTARRFDIVKETDDYILIDDYAHHPEGIRATLAGVKEKYPDKKCIAIFQPHTFSRTELLLTEFATSFQDADEVGILPIYASAREAVGSVTSKDLYTKLLNTKPNAMYLEDREDGREYIKNAMQGGNVIITMGAGDIGDLLRQV